MRIVIHGGMHKTGTTALQQLMSASAATLLKHGIYYPPGGPDAHYRCVGAKGADWTPDAIQAQVETGRRHGADTLVLSSETVSTLSAEHFASLADACRDFSVSYVFCFRHWANYLPSRWAQYCIRRDAQTFDGYLTMIASSQTHIDCHFDQVLAAACQGTGQPAIAVSYDYAANSTGGVVGAVLRACGLRDEVIDVLPKAGRANERFDWRHVELCRLLNGMAADTLGLAQNELCRSVGDHVACDTFFDFIRHIQAVEPASLHTMTALIEAHGVQDEVRLTEPFFEAERTLTSRHGQFVNANNGAVFPPMRPGAAQYSSLTWQGFARLAGRQAEAVLALRGI